MDERTTPRGERPTENGAAMDQSAIDEARAKFLSGAGKLPQPQDLPDSGTQPSEAASRRDVREPVALTSARRPDIAERSAGGGQAFVDAMTASTKERGYRSWAELDVEEFSTLSDQRRPDAISHIISNARDPLYAAALREVDPELAFAWLGNLSTTREDTPRAKDMPPPSVEVTPATNDPRVARRDRVVANDPKSPVDLPIDQSTLDRVAAQRARDLEAARASLTQPLLGSPAPQRPAEATETNGIEPVLMGDSDGRNADDGCECSVPVLEKDGYEIPAAILSRYVVKDGKYWQFDGRDKTPDMAGEPHFEDRGARLATPSDDRRTIADMIAVAHAKGWKAITLNGSEEFCRNAWIEASLAGIEATGFRPTGRDEAMLEAARRERESLNISAGKRDSRAGKATAALNELAVRAVVREAGSGKAGPAPEKDPSTIPVRELRQQAERAVAQLPENVRREVMNRFAERAASGMTTEREHERTGGSRAALGPVLDTRLAKIDQERVARQTPPAATRSALGRGRGASDKDVPDVGR